MAVFNAGSTPHRQYFYAMAADAKPTTAYPGDRLYIYDTGVHEIWNGTAWVEYFAPKPVKLDGSTMEYYGKSTDTKPTSAKVGSTFFEIDTKTVHMWDGTNWVVI